MFRKIHTNETYVRKPTNTNKLLKSNGKGHYYGFHQGYKSGKHTVWSKQVLKLYNGTYV